ARLLRSALVPAMATAALWLGAAAAALAGGTLGAHGRSWMHVLESAFPAVFAVVPLVLLIGIFRYRLWEIDAVASRTLLYGFVVGLTAAGYVVVVVVTGTVLGRGAWAAVSSMALVSALMEPVRGRLGRLANRLVFGQAMSPVQALQGLA